MSRLDEAFGLFGQERYSEALEIFESLKDGDVQALYNAGYILFNGLVTGADEKKGLEYLEAASAKGCEEASTILYQNYCITGQGGKKEELVGRCADQGPFFRFLSDSDGESEDAMDWEMMMNLLEDNLELLYRKQYSRLVPVLIQAGDNFGFEVASALLMVMYSDGIGVRKDPELCDYWHGVATDNGWYSGEAVTMGTEDWFRERGYEFNNEC